MKIRIFKNINNKIIREWELLWDNSSHSNYFNSPGWFLAALKSFKYKNYKIITAYKNKKLIAIIPLVKQNKYLLDLYTVPGDFTCGNPILFDDLKSQVVKNIIKRLNTIGNIFLDEIPLELAKLIQNNSKKSTNIYCSQNYYLQINRNEIGDVVIKNRNKKIHRIRSIENKLHLKSFYGKAPDIMRIVHNIDNNSEKKHRGYDAFSNNRIKIFYRYLSEHLNNNYVTNILYFKEKPIAYEIGFIVNKTYFGSQISYLKKYFSYSPGKMLAVLIIEKFGKNKVNHIDFGSGDNPLKREFCSDFKELYKVIIIRNYFLRNYVYIIYSIKNTLYKYLTQNITIYSIYRNLISFFIKK